jgi:hypothetical protein
MTRQPGCAGLIPPLPETGSPRQETLVSIAALQDSATYPARWDAPMAAPPDGAELLRRRLARLGKSR